MPFFRKKPVVIEAMQFTDPPSAGPIMFWIGANSAPTNPRIARYEGDAVNARIIIHTLEGEMRADPGDWIIRGVKGEFYPCKPDIFAATYERAPAPASEEPKRPDFSDGDEASDG